MKIKIDKEKLKKIKEQLPKHLKKVKFNKSGEGEWAGYRKDCLIEVKEKKDGTFDIKTQEIEQTGSWGVGTYYEGFRSSFKRKAKK